MTHRVHYGDTRKQPASFDDVDIVLTTYGSLQAEYQKYRNSQSISTSKLLSKRWERVILDECHFIKNPSTLAAKACGSLDAERRWCVSGTIIQNSLEDVYSLMRFLRHEPWCEQGFWKAAVTTVAEMSIALDRVKRVLAPIMIRRTKESVDKKGNPILNLPDVDSKIVMVDFTAPERQFYEALYQKSFDVFNGFIQKGTASTSYFKIFSLLQRLRQTCSHVALTVKSHMDEDDWNSAFAKKEKGTAKHGKPKTENATQLDEDTIDQSFLDTLMIKFKSMQRATAANCDGTGSHEDKDTNLEYLTLMAQKLNTAAMSQTSELNEECPICLENIALEAAVVTPCLHVFCNKCLMDTLTFSGNKPKRSGHFTSMEGDCPSCSEPILVKKLLKLTQEDGKFVPEFFHSSSAKPRVNTAPECSTKAEDAGAHEALQTAVNGSSSSKLEAILHELETIWEIEAGSKILIFSQFLGFLDVMEREFSSRNIPFARLDGKLSLKERVAVIQEFGSESKKSQDKRGTVLLISMKAGGVGLNLVSASTVFIAGKEALVAEFYFAMFRYLSVSILFRRPMVEWSCRTTMHRSYPPNRTASQRSTGAPILCRQHHRRTHLGAAGTKEKHCFGCLARLWQQCWRFFGVASITGRLQATVRGDQERHEREAITMIVTQLTVKKALLPISHQTSTVPEKVLEVFVTSSS